MYIGYFNYNDFYRWATAFFTQKYVYQIRIGLPINSMLEEEGSYYDRLTDEYKVEFTTLERLSKALNLKFEIEADTDIAGEYERVIVENGQKIQEILGKMFD